MIQYHQFAIASFLRRALFPFSERGNAPTPPSYTNFTPTCPSNRYHITTPCATSSTPLHLPTLWRYDATHPALRPRSTRTTPCSLSEFPACGFMKSSTQPTPSSEAVPPGSAIPPFCPLPEIELEFPDFCPSPIRLHSLWLLPGLFSNACRTQITCVSASAGCLFIPLHGITTQ